MINFNRIVEKYHSLCATPSDINQLLPHLFTYARRCKHITEMGVRTPTSTYAFLSANPDKLISYDISRSPAVAEVEELAPDVFQFVLQDVLQAEIEETDFLFIDTYHTAAQLEQELARHSEKVRKYIGFHDTDTFWEFGEQPYSGISESLATSKGLKYAIKPFLAKGEWKISFITDLNNGLLIIERTQRRANRASAHLTNQVYLHMKNLRSIKRNFKIWFRKIRKGNEGKRTFDI